MPRARLHLRLSALGLLAWARPAHAAPPDAPAAAPASSDEFQLPQVVHGNDAFVVRMPMQWGLIAYRPRVNLELGWAHQLRATGSSSRRVHWLNFGASALLDRGKRHVLAPQLHAKSDACASACRAATVSGASLKLGYRYVPLLDKKPWLAPVVHGALRGGPWFYPSDKTELARRWTAQVGIEGGVGLRVFLTPRIGVGVDLDLQLDVLIHSDDRVEFGLGLGAFPLVLEIRR